MIITDQINNQFELTSTPKRIVSLVPSLTELIVDLGLENLLVGITKFCIHPKHLKKSKTIVGGTKTVHFDKIAALKPDIILCNKEENTKDIVVACKKIAPTHVSDIYTITDTIKLIKQYGSLFSCTNIAAKITTNLNEQLADFKNFITPKKTKKVAYFIWKYPWMAVGTNTFIHHLLELNKFENIYQNKSRYPIINLEDLTLQAKIDCIFLSSEPYPFTQKHINEIKKIIKPSVKVILVDGEMFSWYGSRLLKSFTYFKSLHHQIETIT